MDFDESEEFAVVRPVKEEVVAGQASTYEIVALLHRDELRQDLIETLCEALNFSAVSDGYGENFNIRDELNCQMQVVRGLRHEVFYKNGSLRDGYGIDDASRVLNASRDLMKMLQTQHEELVNYERIQAIETSFLDTIAEMPLADQERYAECLRVHLESNSPT